ncbi:MULTISPECIES: BCCT family transporter [Salimicrobium]|uniref:Choline transporter n=3 Tax=Salimicrobium TaxID=351195 RepID=K2G5N8_9BACI|nr:MULTISPECIES: BCCT family transporter [Salimicrobium]AKG04802.1 choline transporter [Salimicrobium jeotgali]EKE30543.1 glycine betaine transporter [Salimicrobium jeotgali]MBM7696775.1 glycine betaine transporter [Salimicrobium jeotgali]SDX39260.1 glycine betaine transporter [Salimicrobium album]SIS46756.1 glycine betaine transporter [Salimicrobium salexigens]
MKKVSSVFWYGIIVCFIFVLWGVIGPENLKTVTAATTSFISTRFGWYYLLIVMVMLAFCVYLIFSRFSHIKLGKQDEKPEFGLASWFAMLFSAGMGMGLVFWTTAEPISHAFNNSPTAEPGSEQAIMDSLRFSFFHWGLHAWAIYALVALVLAYFKFHKDYPGLVSATLTPIFGEDRMKGTLGKIIDTLAIVATVTGVAATLGFGTAQINQGLAFLFDAPGNYWVQLIILVVATVLFIFSAWSGVSKGIKYLSNINMILGIALMVLLLIIGPTLYIMNMFTASIGGYVANFFDMSFRIAPMNEENRTWIDSWTIFYWAWWISWSPFVGIFIARISRGRTIKEFMLGVLFVPSIICFVFFTVFGVSALEVEQSGLATISDYPMETATFATLAEYPLGFFMSLITLVVIAIFFITSADSATFVLGMLSSEGSLEPGGRVKIIWGLTLSAMAAIITYFGGTQGLQNVLIIAAFPFSIVVLMMGYSFYKAASREVSPKRKRKKENKAV